MSQCYISITRNTFIAKPREAVMGQRYEEREASQRGKNLIKIKGKIVIFKVFFHEIFADDRRYLKLVELYLS